METFTRRGARRTIILEPPKREMNDALQILDQSSTIKLQQESPQQRDGSKSRDLFISNIGTLVLEKR